MNKGKEATASAYLLLKAAIETDPKSLDLLCLLVKACLELGGGKLAEGVEIARCAFFAQQETT